MEQQQGSPLHTQSRKLENSVATVYSEESTHHMNPSEDEYLLTQLISEIILISVLLVAVAKYRFNFIATILSSCNAILCVQL